MKVAVEIDPAVLATFVVGGVSLVVALTHVLGGSATITLRDPDEARRHFCADHPEVDVANVLLSADREAALLVGTDDRAVGLVFSLGDGWVTRRLSPRMRVAEARDTLVVRLGEFGAPRLDITLASADQRGRWRGLIEAGAG